MLSPTNKKRQKGFAMVFVIILVLLIGIVIGGIVFFHFFNPKAQLERAIKPDTSTEESVKDKMLPRMEIKESGLNMDVLIKPSDNNVISGTVTITATNVDKNGAGVGFFLSKTKEELTQGGMPKLGIDSDEEDGWTNVFNTTEFENGKYYVNVVVYPPGGEGNPLGVAQIPVEIKN